MRATRSETEFWCSEGQQLLHAVHVESGVVSDAVLPCMQVRLQSKENQQRGPVAVIRGVVGEHGIRGLWRGTVPSAVGLSRCLTTHAACLAEVVCSCIPVDLRRDGADAMAYDEQERLKSC